MTWCKYEYPDNSLKTTGFTACRCSFRRDGRSFSGFDSIHEPIEGSIMFRALTLEMGNHPYTHLLLFLASRRKFLVSHERCTALGLYPNGTIVTMRYASSHNG